MEKTLIKKCQYFVPKHKLKLLKQLSLEDNTKRRLGGSFRAGNAGPRIYSYSSTIVKPAKLKEFKTTYKPVVHPVKFKYASFPKKVNTHFYKYLNNNY